MRRRWPLILPIYGLLLFSLITLESIQTKMQFNRVHSGVFYWSFIRLDSDPLHRQHQEPASTPSDGDPDCVKFDLQTSWVSPGWLDKALLYPCLPAFLLELVLLRGLGRLGVNQIVAFFISMPLLIAAWFYLVGLLLDRWRYKRSLKKAPVTA